MPDSWLCILEIIILLVTLEYFRKQWRIRSDPLVELAARTGLRYDPAPASFVTALLESAGWTNTRQPSLRGKFRNRKILLELIVMDRSNWAGGSTGGAVHIFNPKVFTYLTVEVDNKAGRAFELKEQNASRVEVGHGGKFDYLTDKGSGSEYPHQKLDFNRRAKAMIMERYPLSLASRKDELPYIRLDGSELFSCQDNIFKDVELQLSLLNLLCDLADLVDEMGNGKSQTEALVQ